MPQRDTPEVFGQHMNAEAATRAREGQALLMGLAAMQPVSAAWAANGASLEERLLDITVQLLEQVGGPIHFIVLELFVCKILGSQSHANVEPHLLTACHQCYMAYYLLCWDALLDLEHIRACSHPPAYVKKIRFP